MPRLSKPRKEFFTHLLGLFLSISHRINFLQLARHSDKYVESSYRLHFEQYFDFAMVNHQLIQQHGSGHYVLAFDPSYIPKSGRATTGVGKYWSGSAQTALWGLEAGLLSVIDVDYHTAFHLDVVQTPASAERQAKDITLLDHYAQAILWSKSTAESLSGYLAVDAYFAKKEFIARILQQSSLQIVSRLRADANLLYLYEGPKREGRGAPRKYDGKIDVHQPDLTRFALSYQDEQISIYSAVVYCKFLKRNIRLAYTRFLDEKGQIKSYKLFFSTDLNLPAWMIVKYYQVRFQQELLIRDAKQFTGLNDCQARSTNKLEFHWNTALTAINLAKVEHWLGLPATERQSFSMATVKTLHHNRLLIDQLFSILPENGQLSKNHPQVLKLYQFGAIAA
jgi:hypothetical protein